MVASKRLKRVSLFALITTTAAIVPPNMVAQRGPDAQTILKTTFEKRIERLDGVNDYTQVQTVNGIESTLYFERVEVDGAAVFRLVPPHEYEGRALEKAGMRGGVPDLDATHNLPKVPRAGGGKGSLLEKAGGAALKGATGGLQEQLMQKGMQAFLNRATPEAEYDTDNAALQIRLLDELARTARLEGIDVVDGAKCFVLAADGIQDPDLARNMGGGTGFKLQTIRMWIDAEEHVSRRAVSAGEITVGGRAQAVTFEVLSQDYRRVEGMYEPFRVIMRASGMIDAMTASDPKKAAQTDKDMKKAIAQMEQMEKQLAKMPPEQRRMVEAQMQTARSQLKRFSAGDSDAVEMVTEVKEIRVNARPPTPFGMGQILADAHVSLELETIVQLGRLPDEPGRPSGWLIQLMGAIEGEATGVVHLHIPDDLPFARETAAHASASFNWEDGRQARFAASEGSARVAITSRDERRMAGEFSFEAAGEIRSNSGTRKGKTTVRGRFEAPIPPGIPGFPLDAMIEQ